MKNKPREEHSGRVTERGHLKEFYITPRGLAPGLCYVNPCAGSPEETSGRRRAPRQRIIAPTPGEREEIRHETEKRLLGLRGEESLTRRGGEHLRRGGAIPSRPVVDQKRIQ